MQTTNASNTTEQEQAKLVKAAGQVQQAIEQILEWKTVSREVTPAESTLRGWRRELRNLRFSAGRPRTVGLFGESQVGKSYLVSRFATEERNGEGIEIIDPTDDTGSKALSFLDRFNVSSGSESTAVTCRFSVRPADESKQSGCFVGRVISHIDLLLAIAQGFYWEYRLSDAEHAKAEQYISQELKYLRGCSKTSDELRRDEVLEVWEYIRAKFSSENMYVGLLNSNGFTELLTDPQFKCPSQKQDWLRLASVFWNNQEELTEKYRHLLDLLQKANFPDIIEIRKEDCLSGSDGRDENDDAPIVNVKTLQLENSTRIDVYCRRDGDAANKRHTWSRADVCALLAELTLPVKIPTGSAASILQDADILDFPGARAASKTRRSRAEGEADRDSALVAYRRGKLTGLFASLTELNEITLLCLVAPPNNKEAGSIVTDLLDRWLERQRRSLTAGAPPLVFAISKSDGLATYEPGANKDRFGVAIRSLKEAYVEGSKHSKWMENHGGPNKLFKDIFWVRNPKFQIPQTNQNERDFVETQHREYLAHEEVKRHVADPEAKWNALVQDGGANLLADSLRKKLLDTSKVNRLREAMLELVKSVEREISGFHVDSDEVKRRQKKLDEGRRDMDAITKACDSGRPAFAVLLRSFSLSPEKALRVFHTLDSKHGTVDSSGRVLLMNFDEYWRELTKGWKNDVSILHKSQGFESKIGIESFLLDSLRVNLFASIDLPWMRNEVHDAIEPFLNASQGAHAFSRGLAETAAAVFNRCLLELGAEPERPQDPKLPPRLHAEQQKPWRWMLRHWQRRLPEVYVETCSSSGRIPDGNEQLGRILVSLREIRLSLQDLRIEGARS